MSIEAQPYTHEKPPEIHAFAPGFHRFDPQILPVSESFLYKGNQYLTSEGERIAATDSMFTATYAINQWINNYFEHPLQIDLEGDKKALTIQVSQLRDQTNIVNQIWDSVMDLGVLQKNAVSNQRLNDTLSRVLSPHVEGQPIMSSVSMDGLHAQEVEGLRHQATYKVRAKINQLIHQLVPNFSADKYAESSLFTEEYIEAAIPSNEEKMLFLSHEARTPLTAAKGYLELIARGLTANQPNNDRIQLCLQRFSDGMKSLKTQMMNTIPELLNEEEPKKVTEEHVTNLIDKLIQADSIPHLKLVGADTSKIFDTHDVYIPMSAFDGLINNLLRNAEDEARRHKMESEIVLLAFQPTDQGVQLTYWDQFGGLPDGFRFENCRSTKHGGEYHGGAGVGMATTLAHLRKNDVTVEYQTITHSSGRLGLELIATFPYSKSPQGQE